MPDLPLYIVDVMSNAADNTNTEIRKDESSYLFVNNKNIQFIYGDRDEINKRLQLLSSGKYPLIALVMPFKEEVGGEYLNVVIDSLIFATVTGQSELFSTRYANYFKPVLYPIYYEFFNQLSHFTVEGDPNSIKREKMDIPRIEPSTSEGFTNDFVDAIVVSNLNFLITPKKIC